MKKITIVALALLIVGGMVFAGGGVKIVKTGSGALNSTVHGGLQDLGNLEVHGDVTDDDMAVVGMLFSQITGGEVMLETIHGHVLIEYMFVDGYPYPVPTKEMGNAVLTFADGSKEQLHTNVPGALNKKDLGSQK